LAAADESDLGRAEWARRHGIDGRSLNAWRVNLSRGGRAGAAAARVRLVELVPAAEPAPVRYVVRCGDLAVEVDEHFDDATLLRLLRVVASC
jgi:transposase-like protein